MPAASSPHACRLITRLVTAPDALTLAALDRRCFPAPWPEPEYRSLLAHPLSGAWVAKRGGAPVAFLAWVRVLDEAQLYRIGVVPEQRGQGLARCLLRRLLEAEGRRGLRRLFLEVRARNAPACALYRRLGFVETGRRRGYYSEPPDDALLFEYRFDGEGDAGTDAGAGGSDSGG